MNFKFIILITAFTLQYCIGFSQGTAEFWGMTKFGGPIDQGVIFHVDSNGENFQVAYDFAYNEGLHPHGSLAVANNGKYYGMTSGGGANNSGVIFEFDTITEKNIKRHDFNSTTSGSCPNGSLFLASDSLFYGVTRYGGINNLGCIFSFNTSNFEVVKLYDFDSINGSCPDGSLIQAGNGSLYGITQSGGISNSGVLFQFEITTGAFQKKYDFDTLSGRNPSGSLVQDSSGILYGVTNYGGTNDAGVLYEFNPVSGSFIKLADFGTTQSGLKPVATPIINQNGNLMGTTTQGASYNWGAVYEYDFAMDSIIKKADFQEISAPFSSLVQINDSIYLGTTFSGPSSCPGSVYSFNSEAKTITVVHNFYYYGRPHGTMIKDGNGYLLGLNSGLSTDLSAGSIYKLDLTDFSVRDILYFGEGMHGWYPRGSLCLASNGKLYGLARTKSQPWDDIILFEYNPISNVYTKKGEAGTYPIGSSCLFEGSPNILYAAIGYSIFKYNTLNNQLSNVLTFNNYGEMNGNFIKFANGNFYGMTTDESSSDYHGSILKYNPNFNELTELHKFETATGGYPYGDLVQGADNALWGLASSGGNNDKGVLFRFDPVSGAYTVKHHFSGTDGSAPLGSLCKASNNRFYGVTSTGGTYDKGVLFEYDIAAQSFTKLFDFDGVNSGELPMGTLTESSAGKLLGLTNKGGLYNMGVVFMYDYLSSSFAKKIDFDGSNGANPEYTKLLKVGGSEIPVNPSPSFFYPNPTTSSVYILTPDSGSYIVQLFNVNGLPIKSQSLSGYNSYLFDTNNLTPGIYFIKLSNSEVELVDTIVIL